MGRGSKKLKSTSQTDLKLGMDAEEGLKSEEKLTEKETSDTLMAGAEHSLKIMEEQFDLCKNSLSEHIFALFQLTSQKISQQSEKRKLLQSKFALFDETDQVDGSENDRVRLNIGGTCYDKKRSSLIMKSRWNLLSCLFKKRWDNSLLKDKKGRIYFDCDFSVMEPALKAIENEATTSTAVDQFLDMIGAKDLLKKPLEPVVPEVRKLFPFFMDNRIFRAHEQLRKNLANLLVGQMGSENIHLNPIWSYPEDATKDFVSKYKSQAPVLILIQTDRNKWYCVFCSSSLQTMSLSGGRIISGEISPNYSVTNVSSNAGSSQNGTLFPIAFPRTEVRNKNQSYGNQGYYHDPYGNNSYPKNTTTPNASIFWGSSKITISSLRPDMYIEELNEMVTAKKIEVYSAMIGTCGSFLPLDYGGLPEFSSELQNQSTLGKEEELKPHCLKIYQEINKLDDLNKDLKYADKLLDLEERFFFLELLFVEYFLHSQWKNIIALEDISPAISLDSGKETVDSMIHRVKQLQSRIAKYKEEFDQLSSIEKVQKDPIAYFNVEGERICILKSILKQVVRNSYLGIRVSGTWTDQPNDLDEDGNIYLDFSKAIVALIIKAIRNAFKTNSKLSFVEQGNDPEKFREAIDYLQLEL